MPTRLLTFLGIGNYAETNYRLLDAHDGQTHRTKFVQAALAKSIDPQELQHIVVLATAEARQKHGESLRADIAAVSGVQPSFVPIPSGQNESELWELFRILVQWLRAENQSRIILDITHGFRSIPFFAAGAVAFTQLVDPSPPGVRVVYGAWEDRDQQTDISPIWELTPFVDLIGWAARLFLFLHTGRADELALAAKSLSGDLCKQWATSGKKGPQPNIGSLAKALGDFGGDIETIRVRDLLLGTDSHGGSVARLLNAIDTCTRDVEQHIPPLADVLSRISDLARPLYLDSPTLAGAPGQQALHALAKLYLQFNRYPEAAVVVREAAISQHAMACDGKQAVDPGRPDFCDTLRDGAERRWFESNPDAARSLADIRNDIEHAGFRKAPVAADALKRNVDNLVNQNPPPGDQP